MLALTVTLSLCSPADATIQRSSHARAVFKRTFPCPVTGRSTGACPGRVIDHVIPLARGGADASENMQWMTITDARAKDRCEQCEAILPYAELWRSMATPSRAYCEACLQEAVKR